MQLVIVLLAVAVLGLAALVAVGRLGEMQADPVRDTYQPPVPEGELQGSDLEGIRFGVAPMGYEMEQVDELMARMARELDARNRVTPPAGPEKPPPAGLAPSDGTHTE